MSISTEEKDRYLRETAIVLAREGFQTGKTDTGKLRVLLDSAPLCEVTENGGITYRNEDINEPERVAAKDMVYEIVRNTAEYMRQMETAPFLKADGLEDGYKVLADFNGTVLAGVQSKHGVHFVTWDWAYDNKSQHYERGIYGAGRCKHHAHDRAGGVKMSGLTMGSLFDGIGGFPLAAIRSGITPVWASEIEAFPIEVTKQRFPSMIHLGDITKLNGAELPPVDIICGGSPCQDLSVAGARAGLSGARSGLFMEQVRLVKEMRNADEQRGRAGHAVRPRYMLWENVPGAFSSGTPKGEDFRIVLEEIVRVKCGSVYVPGPYPWPWQSAGRILLGTDFSLAWRCLDAQYWGVAQRRKRIFLVADFAGRTADKILFIPESMFGDPAPSF